jgi:hypothetical protein
VRHTASCESARRGHGSLDRRIGNKVDAVMGELEPCRYRSHALTAPSLRSKAAPNAPSMFGSLPRDPSKNSIAWVQAQARKSHHGDAEPKDELRDPCARRGQVPQRWNADQIEPAHPTASDETPSDRARAAPSRLLRVDAHRFAQASLKSGKLRAECI